MQQAGRRFPGGGPNRKGEGLLGDAPPGYAPHPGGVPPGVPPPGIPPPPGVPPPPMQPGGQPGYPRVPPPGLPPQSNNNQSSQSPGITSPTAGAMPPYMGGPLPNINQPPPQTSLSGMQSQNSYSQPQNQPMQQQQQQTNGGNGNMLQLPGAEGAGSFAADTALALVNQLLQGGALNNLAPGLASGNLNPGLVTGNNNSNNNAAATSMPTIDLSVPPPQLHTSQMNSLQNNGGLNQQSQQQPVPNNFGNMGSSNMQYGSSGAGGGSSTGVNGTVGGLMGSTPLTSSAGLNLPAAMQQGQAGMYTNTSTNQGLLNSTGLTGPPHPPPQGPPQTGGGSIKQPLLAPPPGILPGIPPPNHPHRVGLLPNPPTSSQGLYSAQQQPATAQQQSVCNNGYNNSRPGVSRSDFPLHTKHQNSLLFVFWFRQCR